MYYLFIDLLVCLHWKNRRFTAFLDSKIHTRLAIATADELGLAFPPRNLPKKIRPDPSTFYLVIVVTNRQPDRQTYAGDSIIPRESFRRDKYKLKYDYHPSTTSIFTELKVSLRIVWPLNRVISNSKWGSFFNDLENACMPKIFSVLCRCILCILVNIVAERNRSSSSCKVLSVRGYH